jgi:predicted dienelactone hydrolase
MHIPDFLLRPQLVIKIDAIKNANLAKDFSSGRKKLRPVLFSHGLFANNKMYTGLCIDLASHGFIVFAPNHSDGSCMHTQNSEGKSVPHGNFNYYLKEYR